MGFPDELHDKGMIGAGGNPHDRGQLDAGDPCRICVITHDANCVILVVNDVDAILRRNGKEREQLAGTRCHDEKLLGIHQVWITPELRIGAQRHLCDGRARDRSVRPRVSPVACPGRALPDKVCGVRVRFHALMIDIRYFGARRRIPG